MSLTVYGVPLSPYVRKLRLCLAEKKLDYQLVIVLPFDQPDWFKDLNPLSRIPALKDDNFTLADSSVICQYLEDKYPNQMPLLGHTVEHKAKVRWLEKYADYELAPLTTFAIFQQRVINPSMDNTCNENIVQSALNDKLPFHLDYFEKMLNNSEFFIGDTLSLADLAFASQMVNMEHAGEQLNSDRWPNLSGLYGRIKTRPSMHILLPGEQKILSTMKGTISEN
ncbi:glutathione S-transferase family protein [Shewanella ulleungensis]|jgi:glutathione S-transferase|uniref:glutathione S-transferase family protein n=1 Tax=Shewanella ulleungensis TaxID=2282699 RepID=UPI003D7AF3C7